jgi:phosphatidylglycerophosphate synthase
MIDARLLPLQRQLLAPPARWLAARGLRADHITVAGCLIGLAAAGAAALGLYWLALFGLMVNRLADGLDGAVARETAPTDRGAFLDIALDFVFYAAFPLGFVLADPGANALPGAVLIASFILSGTSFLAFAAVAAPRGMSAAAYPKKGIYYLGGLTEGAETIAVFALFCLFPAGFAPLALIFAAACTITGVTRLIAGWHVFGSPSPLSAASAPADPRGPPPAP